MISVEQLSETLNSIQHTSTDHPKMTHFVTNKQALRKSGFHNERIRRRSKERSRKGGSSLNKNTLNKDLDPSGLKTSMGKLKSAIK